MCAISRTNFRSWHPQIRKSIKKDYGEEDDGSDAIPDDDGIDNFFGDLPNFGDEFRNFPSSPSSKHPAPSSIDEIKELMKTVVSKVDTITSHISDMHKNEATVNAIKQCFKCVICLESKNNAFAFCSSCARFLGCYDCVIQVERCPLCREVFKSECANCSSEITHPIMKMLIPGLDEIFELLMP